MNSPKNTNNPFDQNTLSQRYLRMRYDQPDYDHRVGFRDLTQEYGQSDLDYECWRNYEDSDFYDYPASDQDIS